MADQWQQLCCCTGIRARRYTPLLPDHALLRCLGGAGTAAPAAMAVRLTHRDTEALDALLDRVSTIILDQVCGQMVHCLIVTLLYTCWSEYSCLPRRP